jgi:hypothetical protein
LQRSSGKKTSFFHFLFVCFLPKENLNSKAFSHSLLHLSILISLEWICFIDFSIIFFHFGISNGFFAFFQSTTKPLKENRTWLLKLFSVWQNICIENYSMYTSLFILSWALIAQWVGFIEFSIVFFLTDFFTFFQYTIERESNLVVKACSSLAKYLYWKLINVYILVYIIMGIDSTVSRLHGVFCHIFLFWNF